MIIVRSISDHIFCKLLNYILDAIICNNNEIDASSSLAFVPNYQDPFKLSLRVITDPSITNANGMVGIYYDHFSDKDQDIKSYIHIRWRNDKFVFKFQTDSQSNPTYFETNFEFLNENNFQVETGTEYLIELTFDGTNCNWFLDGLLLNPNQSPIDCSGGFSERLGENIKLCHIPNTNKPDGSGDWIDGFWNGAITELKFENTESSPENVSGILSLKLIKKYSFKKK